MNDKYKTILNFLPLLLFFIVYNQYGLIYATAVIIISSVISMAIVYKLTGTVDKMTIFSTGILVLFGSITVLTQDAMFIKMKPTIVYILFASILIWGHLRDKRIPQSILGKVLEMQDKGWTICSIQWIIFCIVCAVANELVWRNFEEATWVKFKVFGIIIFNIVFLAYQTISLRKYHSNCEKS